MKGIYAFSLCLIFVSCLMGEFCFCANSCFFFCQVIFFYFTSVYLFLLLCIQIKQIIQIIICNICHCSVQRIGVNQQDALIPKGEKSLVRLHKLPFAMFCCQRRRYVGAPCPIPSRGSVQNLLKLWSQCCRLPPSRPSPDCRVCGRQAQRTASRGSG